MIKSREIRFPGRIYRRVRLGCVQAVPGLRFRLYRGGPWSDEGIKAISRFVNRVERLVESFLNARDKAGTDRFGADEKELAYVRNTAIKSVTEDADKFQFNTSIARLMELTNALYKYEALDSKNRKYMEKTIRDLLVMLSPFAPHFAEEMWKRWDTSIRFSTRNGLNMIEALKRDMVELAVQINGQVKYKIEVSASADNKEIEEAALNDEKAAVYLKDREIVRVIVVKGRLVNIVVKIACRFAVVFGRLRFSCDSATIVRRSSVSA